MASCVQDEQAFREATNRYNHDLAVWQKVTSLATRILAGEHKAYVETVVELSPLSELVELGSSIHFTVHSPRLVECHLKVNGKQATKRIFQLPLPSQGCSGWRNESSQNYIRHSARQPPP